MKIKLYSSCILPPREDGHHKVVVATNEGVELWLNHNCMALSRSSALDLASALKVAAQDHAAFAGLLPDLIIDDERALSLMLDSDVPTEIDRDLLTACPECGAYPGRQCVGEDGLPLGFGEKHPERMREEN